MITKRRSEERGHARHGWLDAYHTFSFAGYMDPDFMGFGPLRVLNQDTIQPSQGFATHGHQDMEIITYVIDGVLEHRDGMGNGAKVHPGDVQVMSAGTGVEHSEFNPSDETSTHLLQMWILPTERGRTPRWDQKSFPRDERRGRLELVVGPEGTDAPLTIGQDARLYVGLLSGAEHATLELEPERCGWLHVARGSLTMNGVEFGPGDGASIQHETSLRFTDAEESEFVLFDLPSEKSR